MRLVDAEKMKTKIHLGNMETTEAVIKAWIDAQTTVDAVEVVRCKNCIHYWKNKPSADVPVCLASPKDDAFCSEGERKDEID